MMRSLWAGVSGLNAHQVAMDVEGNNIANVNTAGFKYSRVNFSDLLNQTSKIATAPQGELGGKNPMQVGLGTEVSSITKIFKQGSIQATDKNTDLAIQGDGFFVVSPDGGKTYKFTRNGDFVFDANGNFVDSNGYIVQGWKRDPKTGQIDSTAPIRNITIPPGLTTPANPTSEVTLKANLNSGPLIKNKSLIYTLADDGSNKTDEIKAAGGDSKAYLDMANLFNDQGEAYSLEDGQDFKISFNNGSTTVTFHYGTGTNTNNDKYFITTNDLRKDLHDAAEEALGESDNDTDIKVKVNNQGKFEIINTNNASDGSKDLQIKLTKGDKNNEKFFTMLGSLQGTIPGDGTNSSKSTQPFYSATHASSIDIYDSLGTKHTLRTSFRKLGDSTWRVILTVPHPGEISNTDPKNYIVATMTFNADGSLSDPEPPGISFTGHNGSKPKQYVKLNFGTAGQFDGMTSFDATSNTSGISQDGYPGGDLDGIRVDETGTLIGSFTNGRSFGLAQVSMASFTNNIGLESDGGGAYIQTSNSGVPIIGQANTGKRGFIQASSLEMSNVDLSRSLTQLIIIQRGFQANSKTITTSDQMLNTLLQLKQ